MILLIILLDWFDNQWGGGVIIRLPFDFHINNNPGGGWIIFENQGGGWVLTRMPFNFCINNDQGGGIIIIIIIMLSLFTILLDWIGNQNK